LHASEIAQRTSFVQLRPLFCVRLLKGDAAALSDPLRAIRWLPQIEAFRPEPEARPSTRREARSQAALTFAVCGLRSSGRFFVEISSTTNISRSGCCVWLRTCPQADSAIVLRAVRGGTLLPAGTGQLLFQIAWLRPEAGGWLVGAFALGGGVSWV